MISPKNTILIAGDSWGCGEWEGDEENYGVSHKGLEHFLTEYGCSVTNVSKGGSSNADSIQRIKDFISTTNVDHIFWFQTNPIRDLRYSDRSYDEKSLPKTSEEYKIKTKKLLRNTYEFLNQLNVKIHCIGGLARLEKCINKYPNLIPLIPSVIEMFGAQEPDFWIENWIDAKIKFSDTFLTELEEMPNPWELLPKKWFYPDGVHPNRHAHYKIFKYILSAKNPAFAPEKDTLIL